MVNPYESLLARISFGQQQSTMRPKTVAELHLEALSIDSGSFSWRPGKIRELDPEFPEDDITRTGIEVAEHVYKTLWPHDPEYVRRIITSIITNTRVMWQDLSFRLPLET